MRIRLMASRPEFAETPASRTKLSNMALEARVRAALKEHEATRDINVTITANQGELLLRGIVLDSEERSQAEAVAAEVRGVSGVHNQLRLMASTRRFASAKQT